MKDPALTSLLAACISFVGSHFVLSHPLRAPLIGKLGEKGFLGLYSLVSLATFAWMVLAFRAAWGTGAPLWNGMADLPWAIASAITLVALVLFIGSLRGNPALPDTPAATVSAAKVHGVFAITRHPMMWGFALWGFAHILVLPTARSFVLAGAIIVLALLGAHLQDRKKAAALGAAWNNWTAQTSYWPRWSRLPAVGIGLWLVALILWLGITWLHKPANGFAAGIWHWL